METRSPGRAVFPLRLGCYRLTGATDTRRGPARGCPQSAQDDYAPVVDMGGGGGGEQKCGQGYGEGNSIGNPPAASADRLGQGRTAG